MSTEYNMTVHSDNKVPEILHFPTGLPSPHFEGLPVASLRSPENLDKLKEMYIDSLSPKEKKAYIIARDHLGMSFTLEKSVGFLQWKKALLA